jgi:hypothetical protein
MNNIQGLPMGFEKSNWIVYFNTNTNYNNK